MAKEKNWYKGSGKMICHGLILFILLEGEALGTIEVIESCRNVESITIQRIYFYSLKKGSKSIYRRNQKTDMKLMSSK